MLLHIIEQSQIAFCSVVAVVMVGIAVDAAAIAVSELPR